MTKRDKKNKTVPVSFRLPIELKKKVEEFAQRMNITVTKVFEAWIRNANPKGETDLVIRMPEEE